MYIHYATVEQRGCPDKTIRVGILFILSTFQKKETNPGITSDLNSSC